MSSSAISNMMANNPLSHKHEGSPHSLSTLSSSPAWPNTYSPSSNQNHQHLQQPNSSGAPGTTNANGYQVYGVSPTEASTASSICTSNSGLMGTADNNGQMGTAEINCKEFNDFGQQEAEPSPHYQTSMPMSNNNVSTPGSVPPVLTIKDPFDEDVPRPSSMQPSMQQMPQQQQPQMSQPPPQRNVPDYNSAAPMYDINARQALARMPYSFNRPNVPVPYPLPENFPPNMPYPVNRSPAYNMPMPGQMHPALMQRFGHPSMIMGHPGMMMPQNMAQMQQLQQAHAQAQAQAQAAAQAAQAQAQAQASQPKAKARRTKNNNASQQAQQQQQQMMPPPQPSPMNPMMRMPMQNAMNMQQQSSAMMPPEMLLQMQQNYRQGMMPPMQPMPPLKPQGQPQLGHPQHRLCAQGICYDCKGPITVENSGIRCTALNQGCHLTFHIKCEKLDPAAVGFLHRNENLEWICSSCSVNRNVSYSCEFPMPANPNPEFNSFTQQNTNEFAYQN